MRTDEIEIRGKLIQELFEDTFHNLFIRNIYIYIGIIEIEKFTLIIESLIKWKKKKLVMLNMIIKFFLAYSLAI